MSLTASGGKVWRFPNPDAEKKDARVMWKGIAWGFSIWVLWAGIITACYHISRHIFKAEGKNLPVFGNEYGTEISVQSDIYPVIAILSIIVFGLFITPILRKKASINRSSLIASLTRLLVIAGSIMMLLAGTLFPVIDVSLTDSLKDWAKEKYGYTVLKTQNGSKSDGLAERSFDAVKSNGESVVVNIFQDGKYSYVYETTDDLENVFKEIIAKKKAIEEGKFTP